VWLDLVRMVADCGLVGDRLAVSHFILPLSLTRDPLVGTTVCPWLYGWNGMERL